MAVIWRCAAACSELKGAFVFGAITDWYLQQMYTDVRNYDYWLLGDWVYNRDVNCISPIYEIENVKVPVMITHGALDKNVPFEQIKRYISRANALGNRNIMHYFYEDEGHGLPGYKRNNYIHWHRNLVEFMNFYLKDWDRKEIPYENQAFYGGFEYESSFNPVVLKSK